jgi:hypothetical protein
LNAHFNATTITIRLFANSGKRLAGARGVTAPQLLDLQAHQILQS